MLSLVLIVSELTEVTAHLNEDLPRHDVRVRRISGNSIWLPTWLTYSAQFPLDNTMVSMLLNRIVCEPWPMEISLYGYVLNIAKLEGYFWFTVLVGSFTLISVHTPTR